MNHLLKQVNKPRIIQDNVKLDNKHVKLNSKKPLSKTNTNYNEPSLFELEQDYILQYKHLGFY